MKELEEIYNKINNLNYLLDRKIQILSQVLAITENQSLVFKDIKNIETNEFINISLEEKQSLINELIDIDNMFLEIFQSFSGSLNRNKQTFKEDIKNIQSKIQQITEIDFKIRIQEEKNRQISIKNINNKVNNIEKIKTLKISKNDMLKKYSNNNKKI